MSQRDALTCVQRVTRLNSHQLCDLCQLEDLVRTIDWADGAIELIDQTKLPSQVDIRRVTTIDDLITDIQRLAVRGAPALGVAGALGVALLAQQREDRQELEEDASRLRAARPTAVNLSWGVDRAMKTVDSGPEAVLDEARTIRDEDIAACLSIGLYGADLMHDLIKRQSA